jgi:hypothetical protein
MKKPAARQEVEASLYDSDFYEWTQTVAENLRQFPLAKAELEHVADEIADMGKRDRREIRSGMIVLLMHLMKWAAQPELRDKSTWRSTINEQRYQVEAMLEDSPSLRGDLIREISHIYSKAAARAADETGLPLSTFSRVDTFPGKVAHVVAHLVAQVDRLLSGTFLPEKMDELF